MPKFIKTKLKSDSDLDDKELMGKLNDSDYVMIQVQKLSQNPC